MSIEQAGKGTESKEGKEKGIPEDIFKAWIDSNLIHPQEAIGIIAYVGEAFSQTNLGAEEFLNKELSQSQTERAVEIMNAAHEAKGVYREGKQEAALKKAALKRTWIDIKEDVIIWSAQYVADILVVSSVDFRSIRNIDKRVDTCAQFLDAQFAKHADVRASLKAFLSLLVTSLQQTKVRELEKERRDLLDYAKPKSEKDSKPRLVAAALSDNISGYVFEYLWEHSEDISISKKQMEQFLDNLAKIMGTSE